MKTKLKVIVVLALIAAIAIPLFQYAAWEYTSRELASEVRYQTEQISAHIGLGDPKSDEQIRDTLIAEFKDEGVDLDPQRVIVRRSGEGYSPVYDIDADYDAPIHFLGFTYTLHYHASGHTAVHWSPPPKLDSN